MTQRIDSRKKRQSGVALVTTVIVVAVLAIVAVAFMQSTSTDRLSSRTVANYYRAHIAADAGVNVISSLLTRNTANDHYIVAKLPGSKGLVLGLATDNAGSPLPDEQLRYVPLFSPRASISDWISLGSTPYSWNSFPPEAAFNPTGDLAKDLLATRWSFQQPNKPSDPDQQLKVNVSWVQLPDEEGNVTARFAVWTEDLQAYIDTVAASDYVKGRPTGKENRELGVFASFAEEYDDSARNKIQNLHDIASQGLSSKTLSFADSVENELLENMVAGLFFEKDAVETIPFGFGYKDQGKPKYRLNHFVATKNVEGLAKILTDNLPGFLDSLPGETVERRRGGLGDNYAQTIAANIVDYADDDQTPLTGDGYRGVDSHPHLTQIFDKIDWYLEEPRQVNGETEYFEKVRVTTYVQLWNPNSVTVEGDAQLRTINNDTIDPVGVTGSVSFNDQQYWKNEEPPVVVNGYVSRPIRDPGLAGPIKLGPNEVRVFLVGAFEHEFPAGPNPLVFGTGARLQMPAHQSGQFEFLWNGSVVDKAPRGMERPQKSLEYQKNPDWTGTLPGLRYLPYTTDPKRINPGDPRATFYIQLVQGAHALDKVTWWGIAQGHPGPSGSSSVTNFNANPELRYMEKAQFTADTAVWSGDNANHDPVALKPASPLTKSNEWLFKRNDSGAYTNLTELGNVFDPAQWDWQLKLPDSKKEDAEIPTSAVANNTFGGSFTLRVGRSEHPKFDKNGWRANQLLDLFVLGEEQQQGAACAREIDRTAQININTATPGALRALSADIDILEDESIGLVSLRRGDGLPGQEFADAVISARKKKPFVSLSQLADLKNPDAESSFFGSVPNYSQPLTTLKDGVREATLGRMLKFASVRSRNFRVYVVGQSLDPNTGKVLATSRRVVELVAKPEYSEDGPILSVTVQKTRANDMEEEQ